VVMCRPSAATCSVAPSDVPRGRIDIRRSGSVCGSAQATIACPASCTATRCFSFSFSRPSRGSPSTTLSCRQEPPAAKHDQPGHNTREQLRQAGLRYGADPDAMSVQERQERIVVGWETGTKRAQRLLAYRLGCSEPTVQRRARQLCRSPTHQAGHSRTATPAECAAREHDGQRSSSPRGSSAPHRAHRQRSQRRTTRPRGCRRRVRSPP
jgi:hypothetical protein